MEFLRNVLTADFDFAFAFPCLRQIVSKLHRQPRFIRATKCPGKPDAMSGLIAELPLGGPAIQYHSSD
jgi:hypothetical protein